MQKYTVMLAEEEVAKLKKITSKGTVKAKIAQQARALLLVDKGKFTESHWTNEKAAESSGLSLRSVINLKQKLCENGLESIINPKPYGKSKRPIKFDGDIQAKTTQIACGPAPDGRSKWTLQLIADELVKLEIVDSISPMTVHRLLKKRIKAPPERVLEDSTRSIGRIRGGHGGRAGCLPQGL